jgi:hypothetical protein
VVAAPVLPRRVEAAAAPPTPAAPGIPTAVLYGVAVMLFGAAAALWWTIGQ